MAQTLHRPIYAQQHIDQKLAQLAQLANNLMGSVSQAKAWADDVLTDEHLALGLILDEQGKPLSEERLALYRAAFAALDSLRVAANAPMGEGQPSVGQLVRPFV